MASIHSIGLSGMQAAQARLSASAHNVANLPVEGFRRQLVTAQTLPGGGVATTLQPAAAPGSDLAADAVGARQALYSFTASLRTLRAADDALGTLLDTVA